MYTFCILFRFTHLYDYQLVLQRQFTKCITMKNKSCDKDINEESLKKLAQILRNQNISLRKLVNELMQEEERKSKKK